MTYRRLIPALFMKNSFIVRSQNFATHQLLGNVINEAQRLNQWNVDELLYINISQDDVLDPQRSDHQVGSMDSMESIIDNISRQCFMPLALGGGLRTMEDLERHFRWGADKVVLNTQSHADPDFVREAASRFGSQAIVISADYRVVDGVPRFHTHYGRNDTGIEICDWIRECEARGAGEILLHAIDRDGAADGYDLETIDRAVGVTRLPVIACGGAGMLEDFVEVFQETGVSAVAAGNIFHFTERAYPRAKQMLKKANVHVRP